MARTRYHVEVARPAGTNNKHTSVSVRKRYHIIIDNDNELSLQLIIRYLLTLSTVLYATTYVCIRNTTV